MLREVIRTFQASGNPKQEAMIPILEAIVSEVGDVPFPLRRGSESIQAEEVNRQQFLTHKRTLVEILSQETHVLQKSIFTSEFVQKINEQVGSQLADNVPVVDLAVKGKGDYAEFELNSDSNLSYGAYAIDSVVTHDFNRLWINLDRQARGANLSQFEHLTVGEVRNLPRETLASVKNVGLAMATIISTIVARPMQ